MKVYVLMGDDVANGIAGVFSSYELCKQHMAECNELYGGFEFTIDELSPQSNELVAKCQFRKFVKEQKEKGLWLWQVQVRKDGGIQVFADISPSPDDKFGWRINNVPADADEWDIVRVWTGWAKDKKEAADIARHTPVV